MRALRVKLVEGEQARYWGKRGGLRVNLEAADKSMKARWYTSQWTEDTNVQARKLLEEAIALEPQWATPYALLALVHLKDAQLGWSKDRRESSRKAYEMAKKALSLDESLDTAHSVLGVFYHFTGRYDDAVAEGERAVELNPNGADNLVFLGNILNRAGRPEEAIPALQRAMRLNPIASELVLHSLGGKLHADETV